MANKETWFEFMRRTRRRDSRGAALVEFAFVLIPLCLIVFGLIEFGFIYKDSLSVSNASRAGARIGSAEPKAATFYSDIVSAVATAGTQAGFSNGDVLCVYQVNASTNTNGGPSDGINCATSSERKFVWNAATKTFTGDTSDSGTFSSANRNACLADTNIDSVGVYVSATHKSITGFFGNFNNMKLKEHTVMRLEPPSGGDACS